MRYYLTNIRFHFRWMNLSEGDFDSKTEIMDYGPYETVVYDFAEDNFEASHVNAKGATKLTDFMGKMLKIR